MSPSFTGPPVPERPVGWWRLLSVAFRRRGARSSLSLVSVAVLLAGVGILAFPVFTDIAAAQKQDDLRGAFADPDFQARYAAGQVRDGEGLTRMRIPKLGVDVLVVQGTDEEALRAGAGHYAETPLPGEVGNVAIAGHRTTYGRPLNRMNELEAGDSVLLETPFAEYTYTVLPPFAGHANPWPVPPTEYSVVSEQPAGRFLTLTTCHPKGSDKQRLVVRLQMTGERALAPAPATQRSGS